MNRIENRLNLLKEQNKKLEQDVLVAKADLVNYIKSNVKFQNEYLAMLNSICKGAT